MERPEEIDANRARREAEEAREAILQKREHPELLHRPGPDGAALNRLRVKEQYMVNQ